MILATWGWQDWAGARVILGDVEALWLEPAGVRYGALPVSPPDTDRVHAWSVDVLWRLRIDNDRVLVTSLSERVFGEPQDTRRVSTQSSRLEPWTSEYVGPLPADLPSLWTAVDVSGVSQLRFLRSK